MAVQRSIAHNTRSSTLADVLERVLDKGIVIAGDIKIKLVDIELLTIQIRLVVCSVDKAMEMGMDWWMTDPNLSSLAAAAKRASLPAGVNPEYTVPQQLTLEQRISDLEENLRVSRS